MDDIPKSPQPSQSSTSSSSRSLQVPGGSSGATSPRGRSPPKSPTASGSPRSSSPRSPRSPQFKKLKPTRRGNGGRREQSLGMLSQLFVQLFLVSDTRVVTLDDASRALLLDPSDGPLEMDAKGQPKFPPSFKSKVRRLYDIANVMTSLRLVEKIHLVLQIAIDFID
jgi:transcription factor E2F7/8